MLASTLLTKLPPAVASLHLPPNVLLLLFGLAGLLIVVNLYLCCRKAYRLLYTSCAGSSSRPSRKVAVEEVDSLLEEEEDEKMVPMSHGLD